MTTDNDENECTCAARSWYGDGHDSACPVTILANQRKIIDQLGGAINTLMKSLENWMEIADADDEREYDSMAMEAGRQALKAAGFLCDKEPYIEDGELKQRQTATILAALRFWQRIGTQDRGHPEEDIASDGGTLDPLDVVEIDQLCEFLQFGEGPALETVLGLRDELCGMGFDDEDCDINGADFVEYGGRLYRDLVELFGPAKEPE